MFKDIFCSCYLGVLLISLHFFHYCLIIKSYSFPLTLFKVRGNLVRLRKKHKALTCMVSKEFFCKIQEGRQGLPSVLEGRSYARKSVNAYALVYQGLMNKGGILGTHWITWVLFLSFILNNTPHLNSLNKSSPHFGNLFRYPLSPSFFPDWNFFTCLYSHRNLFFPSSLVTLLISVFSFLCRTRLCTF